MAPAPARGARLVNVLLETARQNGQYDGIIVICGIVALLAAIVRGSRNE